MIQKQRTELNFFSNQQLCCVEVNKKVLKKLSNKISESSQKQKIKRSTKKIENYVSEIIKSK